MGPCVCAAVQAVLSDRRKLAEEAEALRAMARNEADALHTEQDKRRAALEAQASGALGAGVDGGRRGGRCWRVQP